MLILDYFTISLNTFLCGMTDFISVLSVLNVCTSAFQINIKAHNCASKNSEYVKYGYQQLPYSLRV